MLRNVIKRTYSHRCLPGEDGSNLTTTWQYFFLPDVRVWRTRQRGEGGKEEGAANCEGWREMWSYLTWVLTLISSYLRVLSLGCTCSCLARECDDCLKVISLSLSLSFSFISLSQVEKVNENENYNDVVIFMFIHLLLLSTYSFFLIFTILSTSYFLPSPPPPPPLPLPRPFPHPSSRSCCNIRLVLKVSRFFAFLGTLLRCQTPPHYQCYDGVAQPALPPSHAELTPAYQRRTASRVVGRWRKMERMKEEWERMKEEWGERWRRNRGCRKG